MDPIGKILDRLATLEMRSIGHEQIIASVLNHLGLSEATAEVLIAQRDRRSAAGSDTEAWDQLLRLMGVES